MVLLAFLTFSCSSQNPEPGIISINPDNKALRFSEMFSGYEVLQVDKDLMLERIYEIIPFKDKYLLYAKGVESRLFILGDDGKMIRNVGQIGSGPGEYNYLKGIKVYDTGEIEFLNRERKKLMRYSWDTGSFEEEADMSLDTLTIEDNDILIEFFLKD